MPRRGNQSGRKEKQMEKIKFKDGTEINIKEGASLGGIVAVAADFTELGTVAAALTEAGNLDNVQFKTGDTVAGEYTGMKVERPLFKSVDIVGGKVLGTFSLCEKTEMEKRLDALENGQQVQDGALTDLGSVVSSLAEGGAK